MQAIGGKTLEECLKPFTGIDGHSQEMRGSSVTHQHLPFLIKYSNAFGHCLENCIECICSLICQCSGLMKVGQQLCLFYSYSALCSNILRKSKMTFAWNIGVVNKADQRKAHQGDTLRCRPLSSLVSFLSPHNTPHAPLSTSSSHHL